MDALWIIGLIIWLLGSLYFSGWVAAVVVLYLFGGDGYSWFKQYREKKGKSTSFFAFVRSWCGLFNFTYESEYMYYLTKNPRKSRAHLLLSFVWVVCAMTLFIAINAPIFGR